MTRTVLVVSGPTHEYFDPVRFIGNASSGLMGKAIAEEAIRRGYQVEFVTGPVADLHLPDLGTSGTIHKVVSADDMLAQAALLFPSANIAVFAAAVADYAPIEKHAQKMAKSTDGLTLHLRPTPDIAKTLCAQKKPEQQTIGFALQTNDGEANARRKLVEKKLDGIVLNTPATLGATMGTFSFIKTGSKVFEQWGCISKSACAKHIFDAIEQRDPR